MKISQLIFEAPMARVKPKVTPKVPVQKIKPVATAQQPQAPQTTNAPVQDPKTQQIKTQVQKTAQQKQPAQQPAQQAQANNKEYTWQGAQWINTATGKVATRDVAAKLGNPKIDELIASIIDSGQTDQVLQFLQAVDKTKQAAKQNVPVKQGMFEATQQRVDSMAKKYQINIAQGLKKSDIERVIKGEITDAVKDDRIKVGQGKPSAMAHLGKQFKSGQGAVDKAIKAPGKLINKVDKALGGDPRKTDQSIGGGAKGDDKADASKTRSGLNRLRQQLDIKNPNLALSGMNKIKAGERPNQQELANMGPLVDFMQQAITKDPQRLVQLIQKFKKG